MKYSSILECDSDLESKSVQFIHVALTMFDLKWSPMYETLCRFTVNKLEVMKIRETY